MSGQEAASPEAALDLRFTHAFDIRINFDKRWLIGLLVCELRMKPLSSSFSMARPISFAARFGACGTNVASPANRVG